MCPAPSINLHFSQLGIVTACCFNRTHVLGVYPRDSVAEIWRGEPIQELRADLARFDLSRGCDKCRQQIEARDFGGSHAVFYSNYARIAADQLAQRDGTARQGGRGALPTRLEFNIHNSCNLECVMCHGLASSAIRTRREGLQAIANPYDEAFVDQLEPFLADVVEADFMGGEPFLIPTYLQVWERIAVRNPRLRVCILTNGTILDDRIKELLERINCWIHVSIDSIDQTTYESIRKGASFAQVMKNCSYYLELMRERELPLLWRFCPMRQNWREIPRAVEFCNENGIFLMFNQVDSPIGFSLHTLPAAELREVVDYLAEQAPLDAKTPAVIHNREHYLDLVHRLRGFLDPANRLSGLRSRLSVADAVVRHYTKPGKAAERRLSVPMLEDSNRLTQAAKLYVIARLNIDQARQTEASLPHDVAMVATERRDELLRLSETTAPAELVTVFLNELIRTYSGVWGVEAAHDREVFERVERLAAELGARPDAAGVIAELIDTPPGRIYEALTSQREEDLAGWWLGARPTTLAGDALPA